MGENAAKLVVCGTGPMENWCRMFIRENPVNIEMRGYLPNDKTLEIIKKVRHLCCLHNGMRIPNEYSGGI